MTVAAPVPRPAGRRNLSVMLLDDRLERGEGGRPALRAAGVAWSAADLARAAGSAAAWLTGEGVRRGDVVLLAMADGPEWVAIFLGAARIGAVCAPAGPGLPPGRLIQAAGRLGAKVAIVDGPWPQGLGRPLATEGARAAATAGLPDPGPARLRGDEAAYLLLTSGSTGPSKWAVHRVADIPACIATYGRRVLRLRPDDVTWSVAALPTSYGLGNLCYFPLAAGSCAALAGSDRSPAACAADCAAHGVTVLFGVPASWARLARHVERGVVDRSALAGVRMAVSAGEHLPADLWREVERTTGLRLVNALGSSEATNLYLSDRPGRPRPGTVGHPVPGYGVRIQAEDGDAPGEGELWVRGPTVMAGYRGDEGADAIVDGWLRTGDRVRRERDGSFTYLGRRNDRFKSGGLWVDAAQVRRALRAHADVLDAVAMAVPDAQGLLRVAAAVQAPPGALGRLSHELPAVLAEHLAPHERPRALLILSVLPMTPSGKTDRAELRRRLTAALALPTHERESVT